MTAKKEKTWETDLDNMVYIIRDEGMYAMKPLMRLYSSDKILDTQRTFVKRLSGLMESLFPKANVIVAPVEEQVKRAKHQLKEYNVISLDPYYEGDYNLEITRLFKIVDGATQFSEMINRHDADSIQNQIAKIKSGEYVLVDDDAVGGATLRAVQALMPETVQIIKTHLLMDEYRNKNEQPILDVVDARDFIAGLQGAGLTVLINDIGVLRVPYIYPFVDIDDKANIPNGKEVKVSKQLWTFNSEFWDTLDSNIRVRDVGIDFIKLAIKLSIPLDTTMSNACRMLSNMAKKGVIL